MAKKSSKGKPVSKGKGASRHVEKRASKKIPAKVKPLKPQPQAKKPSPKREAVSPQVPPQRPPMRRVMGGGNAVIEAPVPIPTESSSIPRVEPVRLVAVAPTPKVQPKVGWDVMPKNIPEHVRFLMKAILKECEVAASWPFPMGKFLSSLPATICAHEFACLVLSLEHPPSKIAECCQLSDDEATALVENGTAHLQEHFAAVCPDIDRKWRGQLAGTGVSIPTLVDQHLVAKVDRDLQIFLARLVLSTLGVRRR